MLANAATHVIALQDYDLRATLTSGQAFRWQYCDGAWNGVIGKHWVRLQVNDSCLIAQTAEPVADWAWLTGYLQTQVSLRDVVRSFPQDEPMRAATAACWGLRLLRQAPWECLASFILSSTKQIIQIQQIISLLCRRFGDPIPAPAAYGPAYAFPSAQRLAGAAESELRACKMGFRAPNLLATARRIAGGQFDLERVRALSPATARTELMTLPGVGEKVANCVLLFAYGFQSAFPVDVWVNKGLRQLYFSGRRAGAARLRHFAETHFGPHAGYAQQYLFHYMRTRSGRPRGESMKS